MYRLSSNLTLKAIKQCETILRSGKVLQFTGLVLEASGPDAFLGEICEIYSAHYPAPIKAEVVGFKGGNVLMVPFGNLHGIHVGSEIIATGKRASVKVGEELVGRVVDAFINPIDGKGSLSCSLEYPLYPEPINPLSRKPITERLETGVKAVDVFFPTGRGQRVGIFAGSGVGKSTLLGMIAQQSQADINVVALIGERGREVGEFIEYSLGPEGLKKSIIIVAGADQPALVRSHAAYAAMSIAEYFKDQGKDVLLIMDSVTRLAMALREIGLAAGEPPTSRGYTPSTFTQIPKLAERAGNFWNGSITAFFSILVEGDDFNEPVSDHLRAILDGHIILSRKNANRGQFPAIDMLASLSRLMPILTDANEKRICRESLKLITQYVESKDMIEIGAYQKGSQPELDRAIEFTAKLEEQLLQDGPVKNARNALFDWLRTAGGLK